MGRQDQHRVDVLSLSEHAIAIDHFGMEPGGRLLGPVANLIADRPDLKPVCQRPQRRSVPYVPGIPKTNQANAQLHRTAESPFLTHSDYIVGIAVRPMDWEH